MDGAVGPSEHDAPLIIHADAEEAAPVAPQRLEPISGRRTSWPKGVGFDAAEGPISIPQVSSPFPSPDGGSGRRCGVVSDASARPPLPSVVWLPARR